MINSISSQLPPIEPRAITPSSNINNSISYPPPSNGRRAILTSNIIHSNSFATPIICTACDTVVSTRRSLRAHRRGTHRIVPPTWCATKLFPSPINTTKDVCLSDTPQPSPGITLALRRLSNPLEFDHSHLSPLSLTSPKPSSHNENSILINSISRPIASFTPSMPSKRPNRSMASQFLEFIARADTVLGDMYHKRPAVKYSQPKPKPLLDTIGEKKRIPGRHEVVRKMQLTRKENSFTVQNPSVIEETLDKETPSSSNITASPYSPAIEANRFSEGHPKIEGERLIFPFPPAQYFECPIEGCNTEYTCEVWTSQKKSIERHILLFHKLNLDSIVVCIRCEDIMPYRPSTHNCPNVLINATTASSKPPAHFTFACPECEKVYPTSVSLRSHKLMHKRRQFFPKHSSGEQPKNRPNLNFPWLIDISSSRDDGATTISQTTQSSESFATLIPTGSPIQLSSRANHSPPTTFALSPLLLSNRFADLPVEDTPGDPCEEDEALRFYPSQPFDPVPYVTRLQSLLEQADLQWDPACSLYEEIICKAKEFLMIRPPKKTTRKIKPLDATALQRLYRRNRKLAMRHVMGEIQEQCSIPLDSLSAHFTQTIGTSKDCDVGFYNAVTGRAPLQLNAFTPREVVDRLAFVENSAPGPDGLSYNHWRKIDPDGKILASMFNICLKAQQVPPSWKSSKTVLILKEGKDPSSPDSFRPISLGNTAYKVFAGLLHRRMADWASANDALHPSQKGFMPFDGVLEHNYALRRSLEAARSSGGESCIAFMDIASAFPSVPHQAIFAALDSSGIGEHAVSLVAAIYTDASTFVSAKLGTTCPIPIRAGVKQGCPLSGFLFNSALDPVIREVQGSSDRLRILAYADDIALIADSEVELASLIDRCASALRRVNLTVNPAKCSTLHFSSKPPRGSRPTAFYIDGTPLRVINDGEFENFLGKPIGCFAPKHLQSLKDQVDITDRIMSSLLAPWQKNDAMKTFFYPTLNHAMRMDVYGKGQWKKLDKHILQHLKANHFVPKAATNNYFYGASKTGALGFPMCATDSDILLVDSAYKLLTSPDKFIADLANEDLVQTVARRTSRSPDCLLLSQYLSGCNDDPFHGTSNQGSNTWTMARKASQRINVTWEFDENGVFLISGPTRIDPVMRKKVARNLRARTREAISSTLLSLPDQGKVMECVALHPASRAFLSSGRFTRFADWRFIHRARLNLLPLNSAAAAKRNGKNRRCRRCGERDETLPHVLNHCMRYSPSYTKRHNSVLDRLKEVLVGKYTIVGENTAVDNSGLRPDLVITKGNSAIIVDAIVPFENRPEALKRAWEEKKAKYQEVAESLRERYSNVTIQPFVVGALGSWYPENDALVRLVVPNKKDAATLRNRIVADVIHHSRNIYVHHISNIPQNE